MADNQRENLTGFQGDFTSSSLVENGIFMFLVPTLLLLIQIQFQPMKVSPFDTQDFGRVLTCIIAVFVWAMASLAEIELQAHQTLRAIAGNTRIMAGVAATASLVLIVVPKFGCILCVPWALFYAWVAYDSYTEFYLTLLGRLRWFLNLVYHSAVKVAHRINILKESAAN